MKPSWDERRNINRVTLPFLTALLFYFFHFSNHNVSAIYLYYPSYLVVHCVYIFPSHIIPESHLINMTLTYLYLISWLISALINIQEIKFRPTQTCECTCMCQ